MPAKRAKDDNGNGGSLSRAAAEKEGWRFVEPRAEVVVELGKGITRTSPAEHIAELDVADGHVIEVGESEEVLLERIAARAVRRSRLKRPDVPVAASVTEGISA